MNRQAQIVWREVDDPDHVLAHDEKLGNPKKITVGVNVRESAVESLYHRGSLNARQYEAANWFRRYYEAMGGGGPPAIDWQKEPVDGGRVVSHTLTETAQRAGDEMHEAKLRVGLRNYRLLCLVCGEGRSFSEAGAIKQRDKLTMADVLRGSLDDLAEMWGLDRIATTKRKKEKRG